MKKKIIAWKKQSTRLFKKIIKKRKYVLSLKDILQVVKIELKHTSVKKKKAEIISKLY